jgi:methyl coenzyme M reductase gamma subunit
MRRQRKPYTTIAILPETKDRLELVRHKAFDAGFTAGRRLVYGTRDETGMEAIVKFLLDRFDAELARRRRPL